MIDVISATPPATPRLLVHHLTLLGAAMLGSCIGLTGQVRLAPLTGLHLLAGSPTVHVLSLIDRKDLVPT